MKRRRRTAGQPNQLAEALEVRILPATFTVTNLRDTIADGDGLSLREAIIAANNNIGQDTINMGIGRVKLLSPLEVTDPVIIIGTGYRSSIDGLGETNLFENSEELTLRNLLLKNGVNPGDRGGAVRGISRSGGLIADNVTFRNNSAQLGGAISTADATVVISNSLFDRNTASGDGGAIGPTRGMTATITNTGFNRNTADGDGGALFGVNDADAIGTPQTDYTISGSQFVLNRARVGGAILAGGDEIRIDSSYFLDNAASQRGGAIAETLATLTIRDSSFEENTAGTDGGAIFGTAGEIVGSSLLRNVAGDSGGGIYTNSNSAGLRIYNSTIAENTSADPGAGIAGTPAAIESSIVALNTADGSRSDISGSGLVIETSFIGTNADNDLASTGLQATDSNGNFVGSTASPIDPLFESRIETILFPFVSSFLSLRDNSPALGGGSNPLNLTTDQIGASRVAQGDGIDMGAVEYSDGQAEVIDGVVTIEGTGGDDFIRVAFQQQNYVIQVNGSQLTAPLDVETFKITGLNGDDTIDVATSQVPVDISAGSGDDTVIGGIADDTIRGGGGNDSLRGLHGDDSINGGAGSDTIRGAVGQDFIEGHRGSDLLFGGLDADEIRGAAGDDTITGGDGNDFLLGGSGNDSISGEAGNDEILAGNGHDFVSGGDNHDYIRGANGSDTLDGGKGIDYLFGEGGTDTLFGGDGSDILLGGKPRTEPPGFEQIHRPWTEIDSYDNRVNDIRSLFPGLDWANANDRTVEALDDGAVDVLDGGNGLDFFYVHEGSKADTFELFGEERRERV